jgi:3',5'-cyclic-AMP phosphodiesterase
MLTRRRFLHGAAFSGIGLLGWPYRVSWPVEPAKHVTPLKVVFYTDVHARVEWDTPRAMEMAAAAINAHRPDLVLCGGDMIADGYTSTPETAAQRWAVYRILHDAIQPRPEVAIGNHDLVGVEPPYGFDRTTDARAQARSQLSLRDTYRSFDRNGYHFVILDSVQVTRDELKYRGFVDQEQMDWLRADLARVSAETPVILVTHMPLMTAFYQAVEGIASAVPANRGIVNGREVLDAFANHRLLAVLQGHLHVDELIRWRETTFITGGAICGKWWRGPWHGTSEGFGVLNLRANRVDWEYFTYGWVARRPPDR